eukprot:787243_1
MAATQIFVSNSLSKQTIRLLNDNAKTECVECKFADISFIIGKDKKEFRAIRGIFAMQCPFWATKLYSGEAMITCGEKIIEEDTNITETGFKFIHEFLYRLKPVITAENVVDALYAANKYNLQNLIVDCDSFMDGIYESTEYIANIPHILLFETRAIQLNLKVNHKVRQRFQNWLTIETSQQLIKSKAFLLAPKELIIQIIQNDSFSIKEEDIWIGCKNWCTNYIRNSDEEKGDITWEVLMKDNFVKYIRFGLMSKQFFVKHVYPSNVLSNAESLQITLHFIDSTTKIDYNINERHKVIYDFKTELKTKEQFAIYKKAHVLQYTLEMSSKHDGLDNTYEGLTNNNINVGVATNNSTTNEYVVAKFGKKQHVVRMDIAGSYHMNHYMDWNVNYLNNRKIQYKNDAGNWMDWKIMTNLQQNIISVMDVDITTTAFRIFDDAQQHISIGCWRFYGNDITVPILVSLTNNNDCSISVEWRLSGNEEFENHNNNKLRIEWSETKSDDIDSFDGKYENRKDINIDLNNKQTMNIDIENRNTNYIFRIMYFDGCNWSSASNLEYIAIRDPETAAYQEFVALCNEQCKLMEKYGIIDHLQSHEKHIDPKTWDWLEIDKAMTAGLCGEKRKTKGGLYQYGYACCFINNEGFAGFKGLTYKYQSKLYDCIECERLYESHYKTQITPLENMRRGLFRKFQKK